MNFFAQTGKLSITDSSTTGTNLRKDTKFSKSQQIHIPIELVGYRSYDMELPELDRKSQEVEQESTLDEKQPSTSMSALQPQPVTADTDYQEPQVEESHLQLEQFFATEDSEEPFEEELQDEDEAKLISLDMDEARRIYETNILDQPYDSPETPLLQPERAVQIRTTEVTRRTREQPPLAAIPKIFSKNDTYIEVLQGYLNAGFYTGFLPFRCPKVDRIRGTLQIYEGKFQWPFCALVHTLIICFAATKWTDPNLYVIFHNDHVPNAEYFKFLLSLCETALVLCFVYVLWSKKENFQWICGQYVVENEVRPIYGKYNKVKHKLHNLHMLSFLLISIFTYLGIHFFFLEYMNEDDLFDLEDGYIVRQAKAFVFVNPDDEVGHSMDPAIVIIASCVYVFSGLSYAMLYSMAHLFCLILTLLMNDIGKHFKLQLKSTKKLTLPEGIELYERIKKFVKILNDAFELLILIIVLEVIPYFATNFPILLMKERLWHEKVTILILAMNYCIVLWFASRFPKQMKAFREWLGVQRTTNDMQVLRLQTIQAELAEESIGMRCGFFVISFTVVSAMIHLLLIYAFVTIDQHSNGVARNVNNATLEVEI